MDFRLNYEDLAAALAFDLLDPEDAAFLLLEDFETGQSPHRNYPRFHLSHNTDSEFLQFYRFERQHIKPLVRVLRLQDEYLHPQIGIKWTADEGLCMLLRRLSYPNRLIDMVPLFGRHVSELSIIINAMANEIYHLHKEKVTNIHQPWVNFDQYSNVISQKGAYLSNIWGFLDGTQLKICRPSIGQESAYNGHKRQHSLKFQSVMLPNGIISHFFGPIEGRRHDSAMYFASGLDVQAAQVYDSSPNQLALYADSAYAFRCYLITPFKGARLSNVQHKFNNNMSKVRTSVEWGFGKISGVFAFLDFHRNLKVYLQPVGKLMYTGAILANVHTCLYSSQTSKYFGLEPPTLEQYFY